MTQRYIAYDAEEVVGVADVVVVVVAVAVVVIVVVVVVIVVNALRSFFATAFPFTYKI